MELPKIDTLPVKLGVGKIAMLPDGVALIPEGRPCALVLVVVKGKGLREAVTGEGATNAEVGRLA